jgi:hypothetical protein
MRYGDYRDPLHGESSDAYWERMERHEREHGISRTGRVSWPTPQNESASPAAPALSEAPEPMPLDLFRKLKAMGLEVEPCPDGDGRWHCGDYCSSIEGLKDRLSDDR